MTSYRILPIPSEIAERVRTTLRSPQYGHPAHVEVATGYGPCRVCLETFHEGADERVLFTYNPFEGLDTYPSPGPIFIHRHECSRYEAPGFPPGLGQVPMTLEAYGRGRWPVAREEVQASEAESAIGRLLSLEVVEYLHVRNREAGCFIAHVQRVPGSC